MTTDPRTPLALIAAALGNIIDNYEADPDDADPQADAQGILTTLAKAGYMVVPVGEPDVTA